MAAPRKPDAGPETGMAMGQKYFAAGLRFAGGIVVFVLVGWVLDRWLGTTPAFIALGTIVGSVLSFLSVYRELVSDRRMSGRDGPDAPQMLAVTGLGLTALFGAIGWAIWGRVGAVAAAAFGVLATVIQVVALRLMAGQQDAKFERYLARWGAGMGLRMAGVLVFMVAVALRRDLFPPLASAMGFLGVLLPLLALETRLVQR